MTVWLGISIMVFSFNFSPIVSSFVVSKREEYEAQFGREYTERKCSQIISRASMLMVAVVMFFAMSFVTTPLQLGTLRFLLGFADGAMLPAVQTLLLKYSSDSVTGRIFGYNQSFMYLGNVAGPLIGASVSAMAGFRWVFIATAIIVFINLWQLAWMLRQTRRANA